MYSSKTAILNWLVRALNADWLIAVVFQTVYHRYDKTFILTALIMLVTSL
jgi:Ni2+-binding GTPase involved in maturation of urease and hydrogenase